MLRFLVGLVLIPGWCAAGRDIVVVDTDSGLFGEDGAALVMLLRSPSQVSVEGITIVPGNVWAAQSFSRSSSRVTTSPGCSSNSERIRKGCSCSFIRTPLLRNSAARRSTSKMPKRRVCGQLSVPCMQSTPWAESVTRVFRAFNTCEVQEFYLNCGEQRLGDTQGDFSFSCRSCLARSAVLARAFSSSLLKICISAWASHHV